MPRAPVIPSVVSGPVQAPLYSAQGVRPQQNFAGDQLVQQGQALQQAGMAAMQLNDALQLRKAHAATVDYDNKLAEAMRANRSEFGQMLGKNAVDGFDAYEKKTKKAFEDIKSTISDPLEKQLFEEAANRRIQSSLEWGTNHRDTQLRNYSIGSTKAARDGAIADYHVAMQDGSPDAKKFFDTAMARAEEFASFSGLGDAERSQLMLQTTTELHAGAIDTLLEQGGAGAAAAYFETVKGQMAPDVRSRVFRQVERAGIADKAQRLVDEMAGRGMTYGDQIDAVGMLHQNNTLTVEERQEAERLIRVAEDERFQQQNREAKRALDAATDFARANRIQTVEQLPPALRVQLESVGELDKVQLFLEQGGQFVTTQTGMRALNSITPAQLLRVKSYEQLEGLFRGELNNDDMAEMAARWRKAHALAAESGDEEKIERGLILRNAARESFYPSDRDPTDAEKAKFDRYEEAVRREANSRFGGKATNEQFRSVARELAFDTLTVGGTKVPYSAATKDELQSGYFTVEGRQVFNKNVSEETKAQLLEAIDVYNAEAARRGLPQKPRTMAQVFTEWEKGNVVQRADLQKDKAAVQAEVFKDTDVFRAYHKVWRNTLDGGRRDSKRTYETLNSWQTERMRFMGETMTRAEFFMREEGLSVSQYSELLRVAQSEARTREQQ